MHITSRRNFLQSSLVAAGALACPGPLALAQAPENAAGGSNPSNMTFGLCTYQWGKNWDLPTLLKNCRQAGIKGVELRTEHAHRVEPSLNDEQRAQVRAQFEESGVQLVGLGSNERFDSPDPEVLQKSLAAAKAFIVLSHDLGASGVKVKPDSFHTGVAREKTIAQIGQSLNQLGEFAAGYGQQVRLEVHGTCAELTTIKAIMEIATDPNVAVCWNSNPQDLAGPGLAANFALVKNRLGATCHVRELDSAQYPFPELLKLLSEADYSGWVLLESATVPADPVAALARQQQLFHEMVRRASG